METESETVSLLRDIRDQHRLALERQAEALAMQREQFAIVKRQFERTERLQERAEKLQDRSAGIISATRKMMWVVLPLIVIVVLYLSWLLFIRD